MDTLNSALLISRRRPPSKLWYNVEDLPKAIIRDLVHDGNRPLNHGPTLYTIIQTLLQSVRLVPKSKSCNRFFLYRLPATIVTLAWASINMISLDSLDGLNDGTMVHLWSYLMFTLYHGISMIVMLNMLIAMMSNSYQQMEVNIEAATETIFNSICSFLAGKPFLDFLFQ